MTKTKKQNPEKQRENESVLSRNHAKDVRYRIRVQQEKEAKEEIKDYEQDDCKHPRVY